MFDPAQATVIIVDDHTGARESVQMLLRAAGFRCSCYESAETFLQEPLPQPPRCVLVDLHLPGIDGIALQQRIGADRSLPMIFVSGDPSEAEIDIALARGAIDFLRKPFNADALLHSVSLALQHSLDGRTRS